MRTLKLTQPRMTGTDVTAWQQFLKDQNLLDGNADGIYGPDTAKATKAFQAAEGTGADGIVGPGTFSRAVLKGFRPAGEGVASAGLDTNRDCTAFASCIVAAGFRFVMRYYSNSSGKTLKLSEARALSAAGLSLGVVFQNANDNIAAFNAGIGTRQAAKALELAAGIGQPAGSAIYFAADFDPSAAEVRGAVTAYFAAVHAALSADANGYRVGVYGSGLTCRIIRDAGLASLTWLAQSTGFRESTAFRPQATLVQAPTRKICNNKLDIDDNVAHTAGFGSFKIT